MNIIEKKIINNIIRDDNINNNNTIEQNEIINISINENTHKQTNDTNLFSHILKRNPTCGLIIIDNFYNNPLETRKHILTQDFSVIGNFPGQRTISYANQELKDVIQSYVEPFAGKIIEFPCPNSDEKDTYNGAFQYTTSRDRSWIHTDKWNNWAGVLFLTPDAPLSGGTAFYRFKDGSTCEEDGKILNNKDEVDRFSQDLTKWEMLDRVGNVFNRLILFNANRYHMSMDYFGDTKENGRLFQVFFFSTER
jgi:hypothetical protein